MFCGGLWPEMKNSVIRNPLGIAYLHIVDKLTNCLNSHHHHMNCTRFTENTPPQSALRFLRTFSLGSAQRKAAMSFQKPGWAKIQPCRYARYCSGVPIGTGGIAASCGRGGLIKSKYALRAARG